MKIEHSRSHPARLTSLIAYEIMRKKNIRESWHLNNAIVSIWASNEFSASESLDYILNSSPYGYGNKRFEDAAKFYFGKGEDELSFSEVVAFTFTNCIGIFNKPLKTRPSCISFKDFPDR